MTTPDLQAAFLRRIIHTLTILLRVAVAAAIVVYLFHRIGFRPSVSALLSARKGYVIAAIVLVMGVQAIVAHRLKLLAEGQGITISTLDMFKINLSSTFYASFLPGGNVTGMAVRLYKISRPTRMYVATIVSLLADRLLATLSLCAVGLALWFFDPSVKSGSSLYLLLLSTGILIGIGFLLWSPPATERIGRVIATIRWRWASTNFEKAKEAIGVLRKLPFRRALLLLFLSLLAHLLGVASYSLQASALGLDISPLSIGWIRSVVILATMIPVSVSGIGIREVALITLLSLYGVSDFQAVGYSLLVFGVTILFVGLVGGLIDCKEWLFPRVT